MASRNNCTSIAFPPLGMGGLRYPPQKVASALINGVGLYIQRTPESDRNAKIIYFVLHGQQNEVLRVSAVL